MADRPDQVVVPPLAFRNEGMFNENLEATLGWYEGYNTYADLGAQYIEGLLDVGEQTLGFDSFQGGGVVRLNARGDGLVASNTASAFSDSGYHLRSTMNYPTLAALQYDFLLSVLSGTGVENPAVLRNNNGIPYIDLNSSTGSSLGDQTTASWRLQTAVVRHALEIKLKVIWCCGRLTPAGADSAGRIDLGDGTHISLQSGASPGLTVSLFGTNRVVRSNVEQSDIVSLDVLYRKEFGSNNTLLRFFANKYPDAATAFLPENGFNNNVSNPYWLFNNSYLGTFPGTQNDFNTGFITPTFQSADIYHLEITAGDDRNNSFYRG